MARHLEKGSLGSCFDTWPFCLFLSAHYLSESPCVRLEIIIILMMVLTLLTRSLSSPTS